MNLTPKEIVKFLDDYVIGHSYSFKKSLPQNAT